MSVPNMAPLAKALSAYPQYTGELLLEGATAENIGGTLTLTGFSKGIPIFTVQPPAKSAPAKAKP
jgi:hypothetical protein